MLEKEFQYYLDHQDEIVEKYNGRYVVIVGEKIVGDYADDLEALLESQKEHKLGTFLIQKVTPGDEAYTKRFHSRVSFA